MWGITGRGARLGEGRRSGRTLQVGIARIAVRGPVEHAVLDISGELDFSCVQALLDVVAELPHRIAALDLTGLDFVDGAGARAIERIRVEREELHGVRPTIQGASSAVERTLRFVRSRDGRLAVN
ncbi:MAG: STAS domain-containing protein [Thermoleophilia bacterium]|nr:STAS domain-containing protein [Thermoleophilia bacterium]